MKDDSIKVGDFVILDPKVKGATLYLHPLYKGYFLKDVICHLLGKDEPMFVCELSPDELNVMYAKVITSHGVGYVVTDIINKTPG